MNIQVAKLKKGEPVMVLYPVVQNPTEGVFLGWSPMVQTTARVSVNGREVTAHHSQITVKEA